MRACLPAILLALAAASPADAATRNFGISGFDRIRVDGPFKVRLTTGVPPFAKATGSAAALDGIAFDMIGRTLVIHLNRSSWGGYPGEPGGPVEISVGTHELSAAWLNGAGSLSINRIKGLTFDLSLQGSGDAAIERADVDQFRVTISGSANAAVSGRAGKLTATLRGISSLDASGLNAKDAAIGAEGPSTVKAVVSNSVKVDASGTATITLAGGPACTNKVSGSASVSGCR
jgi:hypothetical protein